MSHLLAHTTVESMLIDGWTTNEGEDVDSTSLLPLYLGLFLALLAFFIMFAGLALPGAAWNAAHQGKDQTHGVARSPESKDPSATAGSDPDAIALATVAGAFRALGATPLGIAPTDAALGLDMKLAARSLFTDGTATVQPAAIAVLDRTATALAAPRGESRLVLQLTVGSGQTGDEKAGDDEATAVRRAAGLAAALVHRGAPPEAFIAGIAPFATGDVRLRFRLIGSSDDLDASF